MVPSGPEIRCNSSWMMRSGGARGLGSFGRRPGPLGRRSRRRHSDPPRPRAPRFASPGEARELVDRRDDEARQPPVQRLVDGNDRKGGLSPEAAVGSSTSVGDDRDRWCRPGFRLGRRPHKQERWLQLRPAPRAVSTGTGGAFRLLFWKAIVFVARSSDRCRRPRPCGSGSPPCRPIDRFRRAMCPADRAFPAAPARARR